MKSIAHAMKEFMKEVEHDEICLGGVQTFLEK